jgi:hypothetical protein
VGDLAHVLDLAVQVRPNLGLEVLALGPRRASCRPASAAARSAGQPHSVVGALVGRHPAQEQQ